MIAYDKDQNYPVITIVLGKGIIDWPNFLMANLKELKGLGTRNERIYDENEELLNLLENWRAQLGLKIICLITKCLRQGKLMNDVFVIYS